MGTEGPAEAPVRPEVAVLVVDDQRSFADAIALAITTQRDLRCVGTVGSAEEAIEFVERGCPDVVLLDLRLPGMDGVEAISHLRRACPRLRVIVLTADTRAEALLGAADAGADAFLPKEQRFADVLEALRASDALPIADRRVMARLLRQALPVREGTEERDPGLTDREYAILALLADGIPLKQIARRLGITTNTCRGHVRALLAKFDAHSQLGAVVKAARAGLLPNLRSDGG